MNPFRHLALLLLMPALPAAETDAQRTFYDSGNVKESFEVLERPDGKAGGIMKNFYPDGRLKSEVPIVEAGGELGYAPDGIAKTYYANGKIESSVGWTSGKRNGEFELQYRDGSLRERGVFKNDKSAPSERFKRSGEKVLLEPCLIVEADESTDPDSHEIVMHVDSYYDVGAHMGWIFGYRLVGSEWQKAYERPRGDHIESRETKVIAIPIQDLAPGEWRFAATFTVRGSDSFEEALSETIRIEQGGADQPATAPESKPESNENPEPESEGRSR